jgi:SpoVK/Ycf46/Vps4 family AAA+-type ATPase
MTFLGYIQSGFPLLWIKSHERTRILNECTKALISAETTDADGNSDRYRVFSWDVVSGIRPLSWTQDNNLIQNEPIPESEKDPLFPLSWMEEKQEGNSILFLNDYHPYLAKDFDGRDQVICKLRNLYSDFKAQGKAIVIVSASKEIPMEIEKEVTLIEYSLPRREELRTVLHELSAALDAPYPREDASVIEAALGLSLSEAENVYSASWHETGRFDATLVMNEKAKVAEKGDILKVVKVPASVDDIGGNELLKEWLVSRREDFTDRARRFGIKPPRGLLLVGYPGTGKSLSIKAIASAWNRPCFRLDYGNLFGSYVGESEENITKVMEFAAANAPCIIWIDEIEKGAAGNKAGMESHDTTRRTFQILLTSMQEMNEDVFFAATANSVTSLPPELMRAGRFSAKFFLDFPDAVQREEIIKIHLRKCGRDIARYTADIPQLVAACDTYTGAEIECWVNEGLHRAFSLGHEDLLTEDLLGTVGEILPVAKLSPEDIELTRRWVATHGIKPASRTHDQAVMAPVQIKRMRKVHQSSLN